jgi:hypothetical protein
MPNTSSKTPAKHHQTYMSIPWGEEQERCNRAFQKLQFDSALHQYSNVAARLGVKRFGRPTKYREEFCVLVYYMLADTRAIFTLKGIAAQLGISYDTLNYWQHRYPDFCHALTQGKAVQECWLATCLMHGWGNPQGIFIILRNLHGWRLNGRQSDQGGDLREALEAQATGARRVQWDRIAERTASVKK